VIRGEGNDTAYADAGDRMLGEVEHVFVGSGIGRFQLSPAAIVMRAAQSSHVRLAWRHPKAWRQLRSLELHADVGARRVGTVKIDPGRAHIGGSGALRLVRSSTVVHHGKTVIADLRLRAAQRLAERTLRLEVQATDIHGHTQLEPLAGTLHMARS
jgi:hypothetical protein